MPISVYEHPLLWQDNIMAKCESTSKQNPYINRHITKKDEDRAQSSLHILSNLNTFSPVTAEVYEPLCKLTSVKAFWTWNRVFQDQYEKAKTIVKGIHA